VSKQTDIKESVTMTDAFVTERVTLDYVVAKTHNSFVLYFKTRYILAVNFDLTTTW